MAHPQSHLRISHKVKRHTECCNRTRKFGDGAQTLVASMSYENPYPTYKLRGCHDLKYRVSERPEKDYTQTLI